MNNLHLNNKANLRCLNQISVFCVFLISALFLINISNLLSKGYVLSGDEFQYVTQADRFLTNQIVTEKKYYLPEIDFHAYKNHNHFASKYPPGFSAFLALGKLFGIETWVNPLLGALTVTLFYCILRRFMSLQMTLFSSLLLLLNPIFWGYAQSYYPHTLTQAIFLLVIYLLLHWIYREKCNFYSLLIFAFCILVLTRITDSICLLVIVVIISIIFKAWKILAYSFCGFIIGGLILLNYNHLISGIYQLSLYGHNDFTLLGLLKGKYELLSYLTWYLEGLKLRTGDLFLNWYIVFSGYIYPLLGILGLVIAFTKLKQYKILVLILCLSIITITVFHSFAPYMGWPFFGVRYQSFWVIAFGGFVALPIIHLPSGIIKKIAIVFIVFWQLFVSYQQFSGYRLRYQYLDDLYGSIAESCNENNFAIYKRDYLLLPYMLNSELGRAPIPGLEIPAVPLFNIQNKRIAVIKVRSKNSERFKNLKQCFWSRQDTKTFIAKFHSAQQYFFVPFKGDNKSFPPHKK